MNHIEPHEKYMRRALQLARLGYGAVSPNPMVGAVVVDSGGSIVGEGFHRVWGGPHAEVNALSSVKDKSVLRGCTVYVTLEPCSHYGKTPPCAKLLVDSGVKRVVVGCPDPFIEVRGRGLQMLADAGVEVVENVLRSECEALNSKFIYAHTHKRPYVLLKWAQSADGFIAAVDRQPVKFSTPVSKVFMHRERAGYDAIMAGTSTLLSDNPMLTCRLWPSRRLRPVVYDPHSKVSCNAHVFDSLDDVVYVKDNKSLDGLLEVLYSEYSITSLMVEGGPTLLNSFIGAALYQEVRIEVSSLVLGQGLPAPEMALSNANQCVIGDNIVFRKLIAD